MKPLIGITANYIADGQLGVSTHIGAADQSWHALADDYIEAVFSAGGIPVILPVLSNPAEAVDYFCQLDGLLLSGGCDVSPHLYGEHAAAKIGALYPERDAQELALLQAALQKKELPILGICRGCQLLNVALGGSLVQHMEATIFGEHSFFTQRMSSPTHAVSTTTGSRIHSILGQACWVNSFHHQCVDRLGDGLRITAQDEHATPECIELADRSRFVLGIQWHPEGLSKKNEGHHNIFKHFVAAATTYKNRR